MVDLIIFTVGIVLGCIISYVFTKSGITITSSVLNDNIEVYTEDDVKVSNNGDLDADNDTSMNWDSYPFTNHYNDVDNNVNNDASTSDSNVQIIGYIDPENDEPN